MTTFFLLRMIRTYMYKLVITWLISNTPTMILVLLSKKNFIKKTMTLCLHTSHSCEVSIVSLIFLSMKTPTPYQIHFFIQRQTFYFLNNTPCNRSRIKNPNRGSHKSQSLERVCIYSHALYLLVGGELFQQSTMSFRYNGTIWLSTIWASSRLKVILVEPFVTWGTHH